MAMSLHCDVGGSVVRNDIANENRKWLALCRVSCLSRPLLRDCTIQLFFLAAFVKQDYDTDLPHSWLLLNFKWPSDH